MRNADLHDRLSGLRVDVAQETRDRHLAVISQAVRTAPPVRTQQRLGFRRRWAVAIASLAAIVAPVGTAVAAEGALPGELLYPVKQATERVRGVFDEDLPARHRVEELEQLLTGDAESSVIADAARRADEAVGALEEPGELAGRLERAQERMRRRLGSDPGLERSGQSGSPDTTGGQGTSVGPGPSEDPSPDGAGPGPSAPSGDPDQDRDRTRSGSGDGGGATPSTTAPGEGGSGGTGSGGGASDPDGDGSGSDGSGSDGSGSDGSGGDGSGGESSGDAGSGGHGSEGGGGASGSGDGAGSGSGSGNGTP